MTLVRVKTKAQVTLPLKVRQALGIQEGDYLEVSVEGNRIVLIPRAVVDKFPSVTLSEKGQQMLEEALDDLREGRTKAHGDVDSLIEELHETH